MNAWNVYFFSVLNASSGATEFSVAVAKAFAEYAIWSVPFWLTCAWLWGGQTLERSAFEAALAGAVALGIAQLVAAGWNHPRPFAVGLGRQLMKHAADNSFPSDHATLMAAVATSLLLQRASRSLVLAALWFPVAWSRAYLGVHFPFDMLGGLLIGACSAAAAGSTDSPAGLQRPVAYPFASTGTVHSA